MKKIYQQPEVMVSIMRTELPLAASNQYDSTGNSILINNETMDSGNGDDAAVKSHSIWDNYWD